jgi:deazaflavin-dependent oxidoreductase (nitroreductase family)
LLANPRVTIEVGTDKFEATAKPASPAERQGLWAMVKERNPSFKEYEKKTSRTIPVVILTRASSR